MMTLTSTAIGGPRTAPAMEDDADTLGLRNDLGLAYIDNGAQNPRIRQRQRDHLLRQGLYQVDVPARRRALLQFVDQVRVGNVIANVVGGRCSQIGDEHVDRDRYFLLCLLLVLMHADKEGQPQVGNDDAALSHIRDDRGACHGHRTCHSLGRSSKGNLMSRCRPPSMVTTCPVIEAVSASSDTARQISSTDGPTPNGVRLCT